MFPRAAASLLCLAAALPAQGGAPPSHHVYLWRDEGFSVSESAARAWGAVGVSGVDAAGAAGTASAAASGLSYYVDFAVPKGFLHLRPDDFAAAREAYRERPTAETLVRRPCLRDPEALAAAEAALARTYDALELVRNTPPDFVSLGDECGVTRAASPLDTCRCAHCLAALPKFLEARYGGAAAARRAWGPRYPADGPPDPPTTDEARLAFAAAADTGAAAAPIVVAWNDYRAFVDAGFDDAVARLARAGRARRPELAVGLLGGAMPSVFGGNDWERLAPRCDVIEVYDHGAARLLAGSFADRRTKFVHTLVAGAPEDDLRLRHSLWRKSLRGDTATVLFSARSFGADGDPQRPGARAGALAEDLRLLRSPAWDAWRRATPEPSEVLVWYSADALRLNWLADVRPDGASWFDRLSSYEQTHNRDALARESWAALCEDLGLSVAFVDGARLRDRRLRPTTAGVLVLPRVSALSDVDAKEIERFAELGVVVADFRLGLCDARLQPRAEGALDRVFGVRRGTSGFAALSDPRGRGVATSDPDLTAKDAFPERRTPAGDGRFVRRAGGVRTVYLNEDLGDYATARLAAPERAADLRRAIRPHLAAVLSRRRVKADVAPGAPPWPIAIHLRRDGEALLCAVEVNATTGDRPIAWEALSRTPAVPVRLRLQGVHQVRDLHKGTDLGELAEVEVVPEVGRPVLLRLRKT